MLPPMLCPVVIPITTSANTITTSLLLLHATATAPISPEPGAILAITLLS